MKTLLIVVLIAAVTIGCSSDRIASSKTESVIEGLWEEHFTLTYMSGVGPIDQPPEEYDVELLASLHLQDSRFDLTVKPTDAGSQQIAIITSGRYCVQGDTLALVADGLDTDCGSTSHLFRFNMSDDDLHVCEQPRMVNDSTMAISLSPLLWSYVDVWFVRSPYKRCGDFRRCHQIPGAER